MTNRDDAITEAAREANAADDAFHRELVRVFGRKATERRYSYDRSGWDEPLLAAEARKLAADGAFRKAFGY